MRRITFIIFCLVFGACGEADRISLVAGAVGDEAPSGEVDEGEVSIHAVTFQSVSPMVMTVGESQNMGLSVVLSNAVTYSNITGRFDGPGEHLDANVVWFSNNDKVVSASDDGTITAIGEGATTIKATLGIKSAILDIMVESEKVRLDSLVFHEQTVETSRRDSFALTLDAVFSDGSTVTAMTADDLAAMADCNLNFSSVKKNIALVTQTGEVWPVADGNVAMKVECGDLQDAMTVRISNLPGREEGEEELVESINVTIDSSDWVAGETRTLQCDVVFNTGSVSGISGSFVTPGGEGGEIEWSSSNENILSITNGQAELIAYGEAVVTARYGDFADAVSVSVKVAPEGPVSAADRFLSSNDEYIMEYGENGGYSSHLFPEIVYGMPQTGGTHVVSFGGGGSLLITLNDYLIVDGPGVDFTIFENAVQSDLYGNFAERAEVYVSADDLSYSLFPCNAFDSNHIYEGCAGVTPVNPLENPLDPAVSGGDSFDLAEVGLATAKYLLIVDRDTCIPDDPTYADANGSMLCGISGVQGFDLDAVAVINGLNE